MQTKVPDDTTAQAMNEVVVCEARHLYRPIFLATIMRKKSSVVSRPLEGAHQGFLFLMIICDNE